MVGAIFAYLQFIMCGLLHTNTLNKISFFLFFFNIQLNVSMIIECLPFLAFSRTFLDKQWENIPGKRLQRHIYLIK